MNKLTKEDLIDLVYKIRNVEYDTEEERYELYETFMRNVPHPDAPNLISYHKPRLTPEEIVDIALSYKPIILGSPTSGNQA